MEPEVTPNEVVSRFIDEKSKYRASDLTSKYNLFMPPPSSLKLSTYRVSGVSEDEIWQIATEHVEPVRGKPVIARADINASEFFNLGLSFEPNGIPHRLHADAINWGESPELIRLKALQLASKAHPVVIKP